MEHELRFTPSRVDGLRGVTEVAVYPDRLELLAEGRWVSFRFAEIAAWPRPRLLWKWLSRLGRPVRLPVGERDWFHPPAERFFRFFTEPPIVVYLPDEPEGTDYGRTLFRRVQDVMEEGGFWTYDLG
jgi:hypothetical protein